MADLTLTSYTAFPLLFFIGQKASRQSLGCPEHQVLLGAGLWLLARLGLHHPAPLWALLILSPGLGSVPFRRVLYQTDPAWVPPKAAHGPRASSQALHRGGPGDWGSCRAGSAQGGSARGATQKAASIRMADQAAALPVWEARLSTLDPEGSIRLLISGACHGTVDHSNRCPAAPSTV